MEAGMFELWNCLPIVHRSSQVWLALIDIPSFLSFVDPP